MKLTLFEYIVLVDGAFLYDGVMLSRNEDTAMINIAFQLPTDTVLEKTDILLKPFVKTYQVSYNTGTSYSNYYYANGQPKNQFTLTSQNLIGAVGSVITTNGSELTTWSGTDNAIGVSDTTSYNLNNLVTNEQK